MMVSDRISPEGLRARLRPGGPWSEAICLDVTDSTNSRAAELAERGAPHGAVVVADAQTAGRGRLGRQWVSPPGRNLYVSVLLRPDLPNASAPALSLAAGIAAAEAVEGEGVPASLKWPNDLFLGGRKAGGILAEMASGPERVRHVVVGVGINVNIEADEFPEALRGIATSLRAQTGRTVSRAELLARFLDAFAARYEGFLAGGFPALRGEWERRDLLRGRRVRIRGPGGEAWGTASGVDDAGALRFLPDGAGAPESVHSGEVVAFDR